MQSTNLLNTFSLKMSEITVASLAALVANLTARFEKEIASLKSEIISLKSANPKNTLEQVKKGNNPTGPTAYNEQVKQYRKENPGVTYAFAQTEVSIQNIMSKEGLTRAQAEVKFAEKKAKLKKPLAEVKKPVEANQKPPAEVKKPVIVEQKPLAEVKKPIVVEQKPIVVEQKPPVEVKKPVEANQKPIAEVKKPVVVEQKPPVEVKKPVEANQKPPAEVKKPVIVEQKPPVEVKKQEDFEQEVLEKLQAVKKVIGEHTYYISDNEAYVFPTNDVDDFINVGTFVKKLNNVRLNKDGKKFFNK
jgi:hypothetical protein